MEETCGKLLRLMKVGGVREHCARPSGHKGGCAGPEAWARRTESAKLAARERRKTVEAKKYYREYRSRPEVRQRDNAKDRERYATDPSRRAYFRSDEFKASRDLSTKRWQQRNPEKVRAYSHKRRALATNALGDKPLPSDLNSCLLERDGSDCQICDTALGSLVPHIDHVIPLSRGGKHMMWNLRLTHASCNESKRDSLTEEALDWLLRKYGY